MPEEEAVGKDAMPLGQKTRPSVARKAVKVRVVQSEEWGFVKAVSAWSSGARCDPVMLSQCLLLATICIPLHPISHADKLFYAKNECWIQ
jgi:hypothetical protein